MHPPKPPKPPKPIPKSLLVLRRRVLEEMRAPGRDGRPLFESDAALARLLGIQPSHLSHFLRSQTPKNFRGVSWAVVDKLAVVFDVHVWQLFFVSTEPYKPRPK